MRDGEAAMSDGTATEWYLARDGQQFGPITDHEFKKLIELGHLQANDLLWREGFPDWRPASILIGTVGKASDKLPPPAPAVEAPPAATTAEASNFAPTDTATTGVANTKTAVATSPVGVAVAEPAPAAPTAPSASQVESVQSSEGGVAHSAVADSVAIGGASEAPGTNVPITSTGATVAPSSGWHDASSVFPAPAPEPLPSLPGNVLAPEPIYPTDNGFAAAVPAPIEVPTTGSFGPAPLPIEYPGDSSIAPTPASASHAPLTPGMPVGPGAYELPATAAAHPIGVAPTQGQWNADSTSGVTLPADRPRKKRKSEKPKQERPSAGRRLLQSLARLAALTFFIVTLAAAAWVAYPHRTKIIGVFSATSGGVMSGPTAAPLAGFQKTAAETDVALQKSPLWRVLKRDFPEWYQVRTGELSGLVADGRDGSAVAQTAVRAIVQLRRQNAGYALGSSPERLREIATTLVDAITAMQANSAATCFGFVAQGEMHPSVLPLMQSDQSALPVQKQLVATFEAVKDGRAKPKIYGVPKQTDFDILVSELEQRGWSQADMRLFANPQELQQAEPARVCKLVREWFEGQLAVKDQDAQARLLVDALKPVVAG